MNTGHLNKIWESQQVSALTNLGLKPVLRGFPKAARKIFDFLASGLYKLFFVLSVSLSVLGQFILVLLYSVE